MTDYDPRDPNAPPMPPSFFLLVGEAARRAETASQLATVRPSEFASGSFDSANLMRWQETTGRQWRSVELVKSIYGWYVRASSGLDGFAILAATRERGGRLDGTFENALEWATAWCEQDPDHRYAYVREFDASDEPDTLRYVKEISLGKR